MRLSRRFLAIVGAADPPPHGFPSRCPCRQRRHHYIQETVIKEKREMTAYKLLLILQNTAYSKRWTRWSNEAEEGQGGGEAPGRSPSLDAQGADTLNTRVSGCSSLRPLQGGGNMGQGTSPL